MSPIQYTVLNTVKFLGINQNSDGVISEPLPIAVKCDLAKAQPAYEQILFLDNTSFDEWMKKIRILMKLGDKDKVFPELNCMINTYAIGHDSDRDNEDYYKYYLEAIKVKAEFAEEVGDYRDALNAYEKMLAEDRFNAEIVKKKAEKLEQLEKFTQAREAYKFLIALEPNNAEAKNKIEELDKRLN